MFKETISHLIYSEKGRRAAESAFLQSVITGNLSSVKKRIQQGVNPNTRTEDQLTALHITAEKGDVTLGKYLLQLKTIKVNVRTTNGDTPLITATRFDQAEYVKLLLIYKADPNKANNFGRTALHITSIRKNHVILNQLLYYNAIPNVMDAYGNSPLSLSLLEYPSKKMATRLLKRGADPNMQTIKPMSILLELCLNCRTEMDIDIIALIIQYGADVNAPNSISKFTPLHIASLTGYLPLAKFLIDHGADLDVRDISGRTPFDMALEHDQTDLVAFYKERDRIIRHILEGINKLKFSEMRSRASLFKRRNAPTNKSVTFSDGKGPFAKTSVEPKPSSHENID